MAAALINGLNARLDKPVAAIDSPLLAAMQCGLSDCRVVLDAGAGCCYLACCRAGELDGAARLVRSDRLAELLDDDRPVVSTMARPEGVAAPWLQPDPGRRPAALAKLCQRLAWHTRLPRRRFPRYLQPSQAERNAIATGAAPR